MTDRAGKLIRYINVRGECTVWEYIFLKMKDTYHVAHKMNTHREYNRSFFSSRIADKCTGMEFGSIIFLCFWICFKKIGLQFSKIAIFVDIVGMYFIFIRYLTSLSILRLSENTKNSTAQEKFPSLFFYIIYFFQ